MRKTLTHFGWIVITIIIISTLLAAATPAGKNLMDKMFDFADELTEEGIKQGFIDNASAHVINVDASCSELLVPNKTTAMAGEVVTVTLTNTEDYFCDGLILSYNGRENKIDSLSFTMPDSDVAIKPIWGEFPYTRIYFNSFADARDTAYRIKDTDFSIRPRVSVNGINCYVVHDTSSTLGYNNGLASSYKYAEKNSVVKVVTGSTCKIISTSAFSNCLNLKEVYISKSVKVIEPAAFYNCDSLDTLILNEGITEIRDSAFYNCAKLGYDGDADTDLINNDSVLNLPDSLERLGGSAFANTSYESIKLSASLNTVGNYAFRGTEIADIGALNIDYIVNASENAFVI